MIRLYDRERAELEDQAGENGYSVTDWVRQTFGFETEHPPRKPDAKPTARRAGR